MENSYIVLGNGFSIDLVQKMEKAEEIDLANLFSKGNMFFIQKQILEVFYHENIHQIYGI